MASGEHAPIQAQHSAKMISSDTNFVSCCQSSRTRCESCSEVHKTGEGRGSQGEEREREEREGGRGVRGREGGAREEGRGRHAGPKHKSKHRHTEANRAGKGGRP